MSSREKLFQRTVLKDVVDTQDENIISHRWENFKKNFLSKKDFIENLKEEKYQEGFLRDFFESSLGYTLDSTDPKNFNLEREKQSEIDGKRADGVIYVDKKVVGVIELKGDSVINLDRVETQAFNYHNSHSNSKYIIISNFKELRFYIDKKTTYEKFNLFELNFEKFKELHTVLSYESIRDGIPLKLKEKSLNFEKDISDKFYKDYSKFRKELFENIVKNNPTEDKCRLLNATQKLIDRVVFILFAEDTGLLPPNTIPTIINEYKNQRLTDFSLYEIYKIYFQAISLGNKRLNIEKYNGGLFAKDDFLDNLVIDDDILNEQPKTLSSYNFGSDISVNILGHIFEQSISDLEEMTAKINGEIIDKKSSKRKKDGVFYTPKYITKYIVDNTLGKLCQSKREELKIENIEIKKGMRTSTKNRITKSLEVYKNWLLNLKVLDPACGSGAFLNQALEFLIEEHTKLQKEFAMFGNILLTYELEKTILENNLYGVDINIGAVEIAKLSLWLRTAKKGRDLTELADKIKVGNSLIDDKSVAKDAFVWKDEFPDVFKNGGFDVVIGNPPYVNIQGIKSSYEEESLFYEKTYKSAVGNYDIYVLFMERGFNLLKKDGKLSYILPHKFLISEFGKGIREFLTNNRAMESIIHFGSEMVFKDASTYTCIITLSNSNQELKFAYLHPKEIIEAYKIDWDKIPYEELGVKKWNLSNKNIKNVLEKIDKQPFRVKDIFSRIFTGLQTSADNIYLLEIKNNGLYSKSLDKIVEVESGLLKPILKGDDIHRYSKLKNRYFVIFPYLINNGKAEPMSEEFIRENFPKGYEYLKENEKALRAREKGRMDKEGWFLYIYPKSLNQFEQPKIITPYLSFKSQMTFDNKNFYHNTKCYSFIKKDDVNLRSYKYFLTILNSFLMWFFIRNTSAEFRGGFFVYSSKYLQNFPLPKISEDEQKPFIEKADIMLDLNKKLQEIKDKFLDELEVEKIPKKLQSFEDLDFNEFIKEFKKAKKIKFKNRLKEREFKDEWRDLFEQDKKTALELKEEINKTDREIDLMVYELYGLSDDEIFIIESE